jgi:hypothetical protein
MTSLTQRMIEDMQIRNLAVDTQNTYALQVSMFARHFGKSPEILGPAEIRAYQVYLTNEKKLATSSTLIAICALRFLYKVTLKKNWAFEEIIPARPRSHRNRQSFLALGLFPSAKYRWPSSFADYGTGSNKVMLCGASRLRS